MRWINPRRQQQPKRCQYRPLYLPYPQSPSSQPRPRTHLAQGNPCMAAASIAMLKSFGKRHLWVGGLTTPQTRFLCTCARNGRHRIPPTCCRATLTRRRNDMAGSSQSVWQREAQRRWPTAQVSGDGNFAVHCACCTNGTVRLFWFAIQAREAVSETCGHAFCSRAHTAYQLKPQPQRTQTWQPVGELGRD